MHYINYCGVLKCTYKYVSCKLSQSLRHLLFLGANPLAILEETEVSKLVHALPILAREPERARQRRGMARIEEWVARDTFPNVFHDSVARLNRGGNRVEGKIQIQ